MGVVSDYLPVAVAGCCAAAIAYVALSQAYDAAADDDGGGERHSSSSATTPAAAAEPSSSSSTTSAKEVVKPSIDATADAQDATQQHAAAVASPSASGVTTSTTNSSSNNADNPSACNHCKKAPERQEQLLRCSRCHHAWYCSKVRLSRDGCRVLLTCIASLSVARCIIAWCAAKLPSDTMVSPLRLSWTINAAATCRSAKRPHGRSTSVPATPAAAAPTATPPAPQQHPGAAAPPAPAAAATTTQEEEQETSSSNSPQRVCLCWMP